MMIITEKGKTLTRHRSYQSADGASTRAGGEIPQHFVWWKCPALTALSFTPLLSLPKALIVI